MHHNYIVSWKRSRKNHMKSLLELIEMKYVTAGVTWYQPLNRWLLSKTKYDSKQCMFLNIHISDCEVVSSKWSTWYVFINKEYWKYQLIRKQRSNYFVVINIHTSYFGLFNPDYFDIQCLSEPYLDSSISSNDNSLTTPNYDLYTADHQSNVKRGGWGGCIYYEYFLQLKVVDIQYKSASTSKWESGGNYLISLFCIVHQANLKMTLKHFWKKNQTFGVKVTQHHAKLKKLGQNFWIWTATTD